MIRYSIAAKNYMDTLQPIDRDRIIPILDLFEQSGENTSVGYYNPNILYLSVREKLALGLSPRKKYISFYVSSYETDKLFQDAAQTLGVSSRGAGCYRFNKLSDINMEALKEVFVKS